jgi:hypothetical protein
MRNKVTPGKRAGCAGGEFLVEPSGFPACVRTVPNENLASATDCIGESQGNQTSEAYDLAFTTVR